MALIKDFSFFVSSVEQGFCPQTMSTVTVVFVEVDFHEVYLTVNTVEGAPRLVHFSQSV